MSTQVIKRKAPDDEEDSQNDEAEELNWLAADRIDGCNRDPRDELGKW